VSLSFDHKLTIHAQQLVSTLNTTLKKPVEVYWNSRLRSSAGRAFIKQHIIELNPKLRTLLSTENTNQSEQEIERTLRHELAHILAHERHGMNIQPHGPEWRKACSDLGIPGEAARHKLPIGSQRKTKRPYHYVCPNCSLVMSRTRPIKGQYACIACCRKYNNNKFSKKFLFKLDKVTT